MKKIILSLIASITISNLSPAQAIFEHSYISNHSPTDLAANSFYATNGLNYYTYDRLTKIIAIFNENHIQIKSFILPMNANSNLTEIFLITDHLFNNDDALEFIYNANGNGASSVLICNDSGTLLQTFANKYSAQVKKNSLGSYKLIVNNNDFNPTPYYFTQNIDVYSLTGTLSTEQQEIYSKNNSIAFPNPSNQIINIINNQSNTDSSNLQIFNIEGKKILEKKIIDNELIKLDISTFSNGTYIYKLNGETNKFIKN